MDVEQKMIEVRETTAKPTLLWKRMVVSALICVVWYLVYRALQPAADWFTYLRR